MAHEQSQTTRLRILHEHIPGAKDQRHSLMVISRVWPEHYGLKGLSEHSYYPMQFEIIQQSVKDWDTSDKSTMMVQISALPINYDLVLNGDSEPKYEKGFTYPVIAAEAEILNRDMISHMYNQRVLAKLGFNSKTTTSDAYKDPRIGTIQMFESMEEKIPIYLDFEAMVRYHFGIFAFTGAGKSNLLSNILRRLLIHQPEVKVIVFDISSEYPFLLMDLFADDKIRQDVVDYKSEHGMTDSKPIDEEFIKQLDEWGRGAVDEYKISDRSGVYAWATSRLTLIDNLKRAEKEKRTTGGLDIEGIRELVEKETRLTCISISDPYVIKELVVDLAREFLHRRKRSFKVKPYVLFVFDEAQEFVPDLGGSSGIDKDCSKAVETLLRQGRKYGLGGCLATQRIAYLNTNALQQLHTYFVGTLPRPYDRTVVSDTFTIDKQILEKTLEFAPGECLLSSFIATGMENVPIFIRADNAATEV